MFKEIRIYGNELNIGWIRGHIILKERILSYLKNEFNMIAFSKLARKTRQYEKKLAYFGF